MSTVTMNISLTDDLKSFVDIRIKARSYSSTSEYMRDLIRRDEEKAGEERLKALIEVGMASGVAEDTWPEQREALRRRIAQTRRQQSLRKAA